MDSVLGSVELGRKVTAALPLLTASSESLTGTTATSDETDPPLYMADRVDQAYKN